MSDAAKPLVAVIMGSASDWDVMERAHQTLDRFGVAHKCKVISAHRTPNLLTDYVRDAEANGAEVFIAGAGMAAALPGAVAALTTAPVLGVPVPSGALGGQDALHAIVQMPPGIPVGALAIGKAGATNAALLAIAILAGQRPELKQALQDHRDEQAKKILETELPCGD